MIFPRTNSLFSEVACQGPLLVVDPKQEPKRPKTIKTALGEEDFVPDKAGISREFKDLKSIDQQKHVLRFDQEAAKKYGKRNRYTIEWTNQTSIVTLNVFCINILCT